MGDLSRAMDQSGPALDVLLTAHRDARGAERFLPKAMRRPSLPETSTLDGREATAAAIQSVQAEHGTAIVIRRVTYLQPMLDQAHRTVKRGTRPMLGRKSFAAAQRTRTGVARRHRLTKGPWVAEGGTEGLTPAAPLDALAA